MVKHVIAGMERRDVQSRRISEAGALGMEDDLRDEEVGSMSISRPELQVDGSDAVFRQLLHDIFSFARHLQNARAKFADFVGLSPTQYMILIAISHRDRDGESSMGINEIADHLHLSGAFVTIEVNKLVELAYVIKEAHPTDRRRIRLRPTAEGQRHIKRLAAFQRPINDALFAGLSAEDFRQLQQIMARVEANGDNALRLANYLEGELRQ
jgi:MarR family transcriptional regulator, organic hydroperoxide resistance regulator